MKFKTTKMCAKAVLDGVLLNTPIGNTLKIDFSNGGRIGVFHPKYKTPFIKHNR